ncbi:uncharacterized protein LOC110672147 [Hevea brasiliensis]|uniref:uncharacterized protein LOC110672147 n=1 Tax=Hevea brasiliensis TaxID=3981 RepID=UPI000B7710B3|nr:uncharacterized protein LOC110672147 [Hevea brasiliensis]
MVLLQVSPMKGAIQFGGESKLALRYMKPYKVLQKVKKVSHKLGLLLEMERIHPVFHVLMLRKCELDPNKVINESNMKILEDLSYADQLVQIVDTQIRRLRNREIPMVKALWSHHNIEECMQEIVTPFNSNIPPILGRVLRVVVNETFSSQKNDL